MDEKNNLKAKRSGFVEKWARAEEISAFLVLPFMRLLPLHCPFVCTIQARYKT